jgi:hypothetical protein
MSELREVLAQIDREIECVRRGFSGLAAGSARHDFIQARLENISLTYDQLHPLVGQEQAAQVMSKAMDSMKDIVEEVKQMEEEQTRPLPVVLFSLQLVMEAYRLNSVSVARAANLPSMTLWRAMRGLPITPTHAEALVNVILRMTGIDLTGKIPTIEH